MPARLPALALVLALPAAAAPASGGWSWRESRTPHFLFRHQSAFLPPGLTMGVEQIHFRLGMDLGMFSNWQAKDRINLYLYPDLKSYVNGEFSPPPWSNGVAVYDRNAVAIPAMRETSQMLRVLSHETTHLIFVNWFRRGHRDPPAWLNEGLAMLEEATSPDKPETSQWYQAMAETPKGRWLPLDEFLRVSPTKDLGDDKAQVQVFYVQAYSIAHFLVRKHSHLQFKSFCERLRDGEGPADALRLVYHYRTLGEFEKRWRQWLADPMHKKRVESLAASQRATGDGVIDRAGRRGGFRGFSSGWEIKPQYVFPGQTPTAAPTTGQ